MTYSRDRPSRLRRLALASAAVAALLVLSACSTAAPQPKVTTIHSEKNTAVFQGGLYLQKDSIAALAASRLASSGQSADAAVAAQIAKVPVAIWLGDQYDDEQVVKKIELNLEAAKKQGTTPTFVLYAIPNRDCGDFSAGGFTAAKYPGWIKAVTGALEGHKATVLLEPDSLAMLSNCADETAVRIPLIRNAVKELSAAEVPVYLDAGNSHWVQPTIMADRLEKAGIEYARGFFTNVASYYPLDDEEAYATKVSTLTGGAHYVIDVSRNGTGWKGTWCNPYGTGLGEHPRVTDGSTKLDAILWVKSPGTSDGTCNGGPAAGQWFPRYASDLVRNRVQN